MSSPLSSVLSAINELVQAAEILISHTDNRTWAEIERQVHDAFLTLENVQTRFLDLPRMQDLTDQKTAWEYELQRTLTVIMTTAREMVETVCQASMEPNNSLNLFQSTRARITGLIEKPSYLGLRGLRDLAEQAECDFPAGEPVVVEPADESTSDLAWLAQMSEVAVVRRPTTDAYLTGKECLALAQAQLGEGFSFKKLHSLLKKNSWVRTQRPTKQRRLIHAGDFRQLLSQIKTNRSHPDPLDLPAEIIHAAVQEVEQRKAMERARKSRM